MGDSYYIQQEEFRRFTMKLFKTILLSTTLLMSVPFASGVVDDSSAASPARDNAIAETGKRFLAYKTKTASTLLNVLTRDAGASIPEGIVLSADSNDVDVMKAIAATLKALTAKLKAMEATAQDATTTIQTLTEEQAAAAEALAAVRKELAAVIEAKTAVEGQLVTATGRVETLEAELAALKAGATEADGIARAKITGLEEALVAAQGEVTALAKRVAALEAKAVRAQREQREVEAAQATMATAAERQKKIDAALTAGVGSEQVVDFGGKSDDESDDEFDAAPSGFNEDAAAGSPESLLGGSQLPSQDPSPIAGDDDSVVQNATDLTTATATATVRNLGAALAAVGDEEALAKAETIGRLQTALAAATQAAAKKSPARGTPNKKNIDAAIDAARKEVTRLTAELTALGVAPTAATASN